MLGRVVPILRFYNETKTREFYCDFLGFRVDFEHRFEPGTPLYMQLSRDGARLHLSEHFGDGTPGSRVRIDCTDVTAFNRALLAKQYRHARPSVVDQPWGMREMSITDPAGNVIIFAQETAASDEEDTNR